LLITYFAQAEKFVHTACGRAYVAVTVLSAAGPRGTARRRKGRIHRAVGPCVALQCSGTWRCEVPCGTHSIESRV